MAISISISITQNSQSVTNNTSNVTVSVSASWTYGSYNKLDKSGYLVIDGTKYTFTSPFNTGQSTSGSQTLFSKTVDVKHNDNGAKTLSCSASYTSGVSSGTVTASASKTLTTIPRKSTISANNGTLGTKQTITVTRKSSSFTHTITYTCGSASGTIVTKSSNTSIDFTPPVSLASQNTTGTTVSIKLTIETFNGNTSIGTNTKTITCSMPDTVKPSVSISIRDVTGYADTYGGYLKGLSKLSVNLTATKSYNSDISAYKTTVNGSSYTSANFETGVLKSAGNMTVSATVTDKRGRTGTASKSITVLDYTAPFINGMTVKRCNSDGTDNDQGEYIQATFSGTVKSLNNANGSEYKLFYKKSAQTSYSSVTFSSLADQYTVSDYSYIFAADSGSSYDVYVQIKDNFKTSKKSTTVSTGFTLVHFKSSGRGIAFGKVSENDDMAEFNLRLSSKYGDVLFSPIELQENTNLDTLLNPGYYIIPTTESSATITNKPPYLSDTDTGTALIEVMRAGNGMQRIQRYYLCSKGSQTIYQRVYYSGSWGDWAIIGGCTSWRSMTILDGFEEYGTNTAPKYRANGNLVTIAGAVKPTKTITSNTTGVNFASGIADVYRPPLTYTFVCQGSGINRWLLTVNTDGTISVSRYGTNSYVDISSGSWLTFNVTYSI